MNKSITICMSLIIAALLALSAGSAWANTAANTQIINNATLTFNGGSASASVTVTVALLPSTPNVTITSVQNANYTAANTLTVTDTVTITSTANGPASYTVAPTVSTSTNTTLPTVTGGTSVTVGATVTTGTSTLTALTVPAAANDANNNGTTINGISSASPNIVFTFTVAGVPTTFTRTVASVVNPGSGTATINLGGGPLPAVPPSGMQVGEQKPVNLTVLPGTVQTTGADITATVQAVVSNPGASSVTATTDSSAPSNAPPNSWKTPSANVQITKYVRNATTDASLVGSPAATSITVNGAAHNYYASSVSSGVSGKPTEQLEYVIVAKNIGVTDINGCNISDVIPTSFVSFATGQISGKDIWYINASGTGVALFTADQGSYSAPNLTVNVGNGAAAATTGTIPAGQQVTIAYRVIIN